MMACPTISETTSGWVPRARSKIAQVWRRSWILFDGSVSLGYRRGGTVGLGDRSGRTSAGSVPPPAGSGVGAGLRMRILESEGSVPGAGGVGCGA